MVDFGKLNDDRKRRERLAKFIGMLGSDHDGEVLNAARFIRKMAEEQKVTLAELLMAPTKTVVQERVVYREAPMQPARRDDFQYGAYHGRRYKTHFDEASADSLDDRTILDAIKAILNSGEDMACLDVGMQDFVSSAPFQYNYDWELSNQQRKYAKVILRYWKARDAEPLI